MVVQLILAVMGMLSMKVEARKLVPRQETILMMRKMLPVDYLDGCGCYSDDDCRNTPGCGSYCSPAPVVGICKENGPAHQE